MRKFVLIACFMALFSLALGAQGIPVCKEVPFQAGERISMGVTFKWGAINAEVAQAYLLLEQEEDCYHATMAARTAPFFEVFYKIRENFQSRFAVDDFRPMEAIRDTYESGYTATNHFIYDWDAGFIRAEVSYRGAAPEYKEIPLENFAFDIVTLFYYLRNQDWTQAEDGQACYVPFAIDDEVFSVRITYQGKEKLKVRKMGVYRGIHLSCTVVAGVLFTGEQELQVWLSDDDNRVPLALMVPLKVGTLWAWFKGAEGLKFPMEAKG